METRKRIILMFNKSQGIVWKSLLEHADDHLLQEGGDVVFAMIGVKNYDLSDHQFLSVVWAVDKKDLKVLIPRGIVAAIIEGEQATQVGFSAAPR